MTRTIKSELIQASREHPLLAPVRVDAVRYLNTVPLVWGMLHGPQSSQVHLSFSLPSVCADRLKRGLVDLGIVPVAEIARNAWTIVSDIGITCLGAVRSILLCSRIPLRNVKTMVADQGSRTSVELARVILRERYGSEPSIIAGPPDLSQMLEQADAGLVIGDPALRINPETANCECVDLGQEWFALTGLPMVFAAWAGKFADGEHRLRELTRGSYLFGQAALDEIVETEHERRGVTKGLARDYLTRYIRFEIGSAERRGLQAFYELARLGREVAV